MACFRIAIRTLGLAALLTFALSVAAEAKEIGFVGNTFYRYQGNQLTITADKVQNFRGGGYSGTLKFDLWATKNYYNGGVISGTILGTFTREGLSAGYSYNGLSQQVRMNYPAPGEYWITLTVAEYDNGRYVTVDYVTYPNTVWFKGTAAPAVPRAAPAGKPLAFVGGVSYAYKGSVLTLRANQILNRRGGGYSGTLRLQLWATRKTYSGGGINGYILGTAQLKSLNAGYSYNKLAQTTRFFPPPHGRYRLTLTLEEYDSGEYTIVDYVNMDDPLDY